MSRSEKRNDGDAHHEMKDLKESPPSSLSSGASANDVLPTTENSISRGPQLHPAFYIAAWIFFSNSTILFNKWILDNRGFEFPAILTTIHLAFSVVMTQILARTAPSLLNPRAVHMTGKIYLRNIIPIGILYSFSLIFSNLVYIYLGVAYIQMLKAAAPTVVLLTAWAFKTQDPSLRKLLNVLIITFGVALTSVGERHFSMVGFMYQIGGIIFEALRITLIEILVNGRTDGSGRSGLQKMDPLVTLYFYAPVCMVTNFVVALLFESHTFTLSDFNRIGPFMLIASTVVAFLLNVSSIFLIGRTSGIVLTLSGIFKNVLLVFASALWGTTITGLQWFGYTIAILGLFYYSVGADGVREIIIKLQLGQNGAIAQKLNKSGIITRIQILWENREEVLSARTKKKLTFIIAGAVLLMILMGLMYGPEINSLLSPTNVIRTGADVSSGGRS